MAQYFKTNVAGDLTGNLPQPTVAKIQGTPVSASAPSTNQIFSFTGSNWTPTAFPLITNVIEGYTSTATAGTTTTLSTSSTRQQYFTGSTTQTVRLPVTTTLVNGQKYIIVNNSTGIVSIQTGGAAAITTVPANTTNTFTCINNASDVAASWSYTGVAASLGSVTGVLLPANGGTGIANSNANTITVGGAVSIGAAFTTSANALTLTTTGATNVTLPTTGTLVNTAVATLSSLTSIGTITTGTWNATTIAAVNGGTGNTVYAVGDLLFANTTSTLSRLADVATGQVLVSGGVGVAPAYSANPTLTGLTLSGLTASQAVVTNGSNALVSLSYTAAATASTLMSRDTNANTRINNLIEGYATTATAAGTTTLTVASVQQQYFTGSTTQIVRLPVTTTLVNGQQYTIVNNSTGALTIQTGGAAAITTVPANTANTFTCINNGSDVAASWSYTGVAASLSSVTGVLLPANGGTGIANSNANTITVGGAVSIGAAFTTSANALTLTTTGATNVTLPTTGTLVNTAVATLSSLTSIGTITTGTWNGSVITGTYGGTGVNNGASTITLAANFATSGANSLTLTTTGATNVTLPTTGTLVNSAVATLSSLTSIGTITTGTWNGTTIAAGFGGTGSTAAFIAGGVAYGMSTSVMSTTAAGTSGQILISAGAGAPTWTSTPTFSSATISSGGNITVSGGGTIVGLPTTPVNPTDAASKAYVDASLTGISWKATAAYATAAALPSNTYSNGASGVGATLTATANGILTVDGTALSVIGTRVLVKNEAISANNGVYQLSTVGTAGVPYVLTRTVDADTSSEMNNAALFVTNGSANMGIAFTQTTAMPTMGTSSIVFVQFGGATIYTAGTGLTLSGAQFSLVTPVTAVNGGTGVSNSFNITVGGALTTAGPLITSGASSLTLTTTAATNVTLPTSGTLVNSSVATLSSLTSVGTITTGTWNGTAIAAANGGTGNTVYVVGDLLFANTTSTLARLADVATGSALTSGGVGVAPLWTAFTSNATVSTLMSRDANGNTRINNLIEGYTTTATAAGTTVLSVTSTVLQYFTGATTQIIRLPVTTTLVNGQQYQFVNISTGALTIQTGGAAAITTVPAGTSILFTCINNASDVAASWNFTAPAVGTVGTTLTLTGLTANSFLFSGTGGLLTTTAAPTNGQLLIGSTGVAPVAAALTQGTGISITNGAGSITIANIGVTSLSAGTTGLSVSASTGAITLSGTLVVSNGGTGQTTFTAGALLLGNGTTALSSLADVAVGSALTSGGVGVNPVWTAFTNNATASTLMSRDANVNTRINNLIEGYATTATAAGTTVLTVASTFLQYFTGSTTQIVRLPVTTTLVNGQRYQIVNTSTGILTIQTGGAAAITTIPAGNSILFTCINNASDVAASWNFTAPAVGTVGTTLTLTGLTANSFLFSGTGGLLTTTAAPTNGQILVGVTGSAPSLVSVSKDVSLTSTGVATVVSINSMPITTTGNNVMGSIYFGYSSTVPSGAGNLAIGHQALNVSQGSTSIALGTKALFNSYFGVGNVVIGVGQTGLNLNGRNNVGISEGVLTGVVYTTGTAFQSSTVITGVGTTFSASMIGGYIRYSDGSWTPIFDFVSATSLVASGSQTVSSTPGLSFQIFYPVEYNVAIGTGTLSNTASRRSVAIGDQSLSNTTNPTYSVGTAGTGGVSSTTITGSGTQWFSQVTGGKIVFAGGVTGTISAFVSATSITVSVAVTVANGTAYTIFLPNSHNIGIGFNAGSSLTNGAHNILIGVSTNVSASTFSAIAIGNGATATSDQSIALGQGITANQTDGFFVRHRGPISAATNTAGFIAGTNELVEITSSIRFKTNIRDLEDISDKFDQLRPVRFNPIEGHGDVNTEHIGLIAEEVEELWPEFITHNTEGLTTGITYDRMISVLIKEIQTLKRRMEQYEQV